LGVPLAAHPVISVDAQLDPRQMSEKQRTYERRLMANAGTEIIIPTNPARKIDKPVVPDSDSTVNYLEPEHIGAFLERSGCHRLGPLFELAVYPGVRRGEITGLHWSDVDLPLARLLSGTTG
jgi:integrase